MCFNVISVITDTDVKHSTLQASLTDDTTTTKRTTLNIK